MCGRYTVTASARKFKRLFPSVDLTGLEPRYNIAPTQNVAVVRQRPEGELECVRMRWGLIPSWADDPVVGNRMINARSETAATKPAFRSAFKQRRCLVLADGFYEWQKTHGHKQPFYIHLRDSQPFAFAGLLDHWAKGDTPIDSCTILTTDANELVRPLHDRMPVILDGTGLDRWLDQAEAVLLRPFPSELMVACPVSKRVNSPRNDEPSCVEPVSPPPVETSLFD